MNFSEALKAMKRGSKVSREAWRGRKSYWIIVEYKDDITSGMSKQIQEHYPDGTWNYISELNVSAVLDDDWWIVT